MGIDKLNELTEKQKLNIPKVISGDYKIDLVQDDEKINKYLTKKSTDLKTLEVNASIEAGKILTEVYNELSGKNQYDGLYQAWLDYMEYPVRTALRHRVRYSLVQAAKKPEGKKLFATIPVKILEKLHTHEEREYFISLVNQGEIKSKKELEGYLSSEEAGETNKVFKPVTPFYKKIFTYEKDIKKLEKGKEIKAIEEIEHGIKELRRLKKILEDRREAGELENNKKLPGTE